MDNVWIRFCTQNTEAIFKIGIQKVAESNIVASIEQVSASKCTGCPSKISRHNKLLKSQLQRFLSYVRFKLSNLSRNGSLINSKFSGAETAEFFPIKVQLSDLSDWDFREKYSLNSAEFFTSNFSSVISVTELIATIF